MEMNKSKRIITTLLLCVICFGAFIYSRGEIYWKLFVEISGVLLAFSAVIIAYVGYQIQDYSRRKEQFLFLNKCLNTNQNRICDFIYENARKGKDEGKTPYLFYKEEWMRSSKELVPIQSISLKAGTDERVASKKRTKIERQFRKLGLLPNCDRSMTDNLLMFTDVRLYDAPSYFCDSFTINENDEIEVTVSKGSYFWFVNTCFPFGFEAAYNCYCNYKMRNGLLRLRKDFPIFEFRNRYSSFGIVTLVVLVNVDLYGNNEELQNFFLLHKRGTGVSESQGMINAVPGCTFQPTSGQQYGGLQNELDSEGIAFTITREFMEEIKSLEEFSFQTSPDRIKNEPLLKIVQNNCYYLGGGINPINAYFEMLTLLFLDMNNEEVQGYFGGTTLETIREGLKPNEEGTIFIEPYERDNLLFYENNIKSTPALKEICHILLENKTISGLINRPHNPPMEQERARD